MSDSIRVRNEILADLAASQPDGKEIDIDAASREITGILEGMDRKKSEDARTSHRVDKKREKLDVIASEFHRRTGRNIDREWETMRNEGEELIASKPSIVEAKGLRQIGIDRLCERLRWMRSKPEMFEQVKGLSVALNMGNKETRERAAQKLREVLERSNKLAGFDWMKGKPSKLIFS